MKKCRLVIMMVLASALLAMLPVGPSYARQDTLSCNNFVNSSQDVRVSYYMGEGMGYLQSGELWQARHSFSCVVEQLAPDYIPGYMARAIVFTRQREYRAAIADFSRVIELDSSYARAYNNRSIVYAAQLEYALALDDLNRAIAQDDRYAIAYHNRGVIYAIQRDYASAIDDLNQSIALSGIEAVVEELSDPARKADAPRPLIPHEDAYPYAVLGIVYSLQALENYQDYLLLTGSMGDARVQSAAGALESRLNFELRLDDGTWMLATDFALTAP